MQDHHILGDSRKIPLRCIVLVSRLVILIATICCICSISRSFSPGEQIDAGIHDLDSAILTLVQQRRFDMFAHAVNPILNVSSFDESVAWFEKIGFKKMWDWGEPPSFGAVKSGNVEIFLCWGGQGGRGKSPVKMTFGPDGDQTADKGVWMSLWVEDVDAVYSECVAQDRKSVM